MVYGPRLASSLSVRAAQWFVESSRVNSTTLLDKSLWNFSTLCPPQCLLANESEICLRRAILTFSV